MLKVLVLFVLVRRILWSLWYVVVYVCHCATVVHVVCCLPGWDVHPAAARHLRRLIQHHHHGHLPVTGALLGLRYPTLTILFSKNIIELIVLGAA